MQDNPKYITEEDKQEKEDETLVKLEEVLFKVEEAVESNIQKKVRKRKVKATPQIIQEQVCCSRL